MRAQRPWTWQGRWERVAGHGGAQRIQAAMVGEGPDRSQNRSGEAAGSFVVSLLCVIDSLGLKEVADSVKREGTKSDSTMELFL